MAIDIVDLPIKDGDCSIVISHYPNRRGPLCQGRQLSHLEDGEFKFRERKGFIYYHLSYLQYIHILNIDME